MRTERLYQALKGLAQVAATVSLGLSLGSSGCGFSSSSGYQYDYIPTGPVSGIWAGASTVINPGVQAGYGITANVGGSFRTVWTGDAGVSGSHRSFQGSIYTPGHFLSVTPGCAGNGCALESGDYVSLPIQVSGGERIDFDTTATTGIDGVDFVVSLEPVYFDLYIDGGPYPELVYFPDSNQGGAIASAPSMPFGLTTR